MPGRRRCFLQSLLPCFPPRARVCAAPSDVGRSGEDGPSSFLETQPSLVCVTLGNGLGRVKWKLTTG